MDLTAFWEKLETNFPLGGPRKYLNELLGADLVDALEHGKVLSYLRIAETYPCPHPGGADCPRQVIHHSDDSYQAVCGNNPPECSDLELTKDDVEVIGVSPEALCEALRSPLSFGGKPEKITGLRHVYRAGTFKPDPGIRQAIYFAVLCSPADYAGAIDALRSRHEDSQFAVLVPTDRFLKADTIRQMESLGIPIIPLSGLVNLDSSGTFTTSVDPLQLFEGIGRKGPGKVLPDRSVYAQLFIKEGWRDLDEDEYQRLLEASNEYEIFADERSKTICKTVNGKPERKERVQSSHFKMIRDALESRGRFDPVTDYRYEELQNPKQTFVRARASLDIKYKDTNGKETWRLFKTITVDNHSVYQFDPDPDIAFALIFLPRS